MAPLLPEHGLSKIAAKYCGKSVLLLLFSLTVALPAGAETPKRILVLDSFGRDATPAPAAMKQSSAGCLDK